MPSKLNCKYCGEKLRYVNESETTFYGVDITREHYYCDNCKKRKFIVVNPESKKHVKLDRPSQLNHFQTTSKPLPNNKKPLPLKQYKSREERIAESKKWIKDQQFEKEYDDDGKLWYVDDDGDYVGINANGYLIDENFEDYFGENFEE